MELPSDFFVKPVDGQTDLFQFGFGFTLEGKALDQPVVTVEENGDLIIEGFAAVFEGIDREGENFDAGAFQRGIKSFLDGQASLCYHHQNGKLLGKVLELDEKPGKGLWMRARVDGEIQNHPELGTYYGQIKKGSLDALSVGGFFKRNPMRNKIVDMDFTEISVTPVPVHPGTKFAVVAGKALASDVEMPDALNVDGSEEIRAEDLRSINWLFEELDALFRRIEDSVGNRKTSAS